MIRWLQTRTKTWKHGLGYLRIIDLCKLLRTRITHFYSFFISCSSYFCAINCNYVLGLCCPFVQSLSISVLVNIYLWIGWQIFIKTNFVFKRKRNLCVNNSFKKIDPRLIIFQQKLIPLVSWKNVEKLPKIQTFDFVHELNWLPLSSLVDHCLLSSCLASSKLYN